MLACSPTRMPPHAHLLDTQISSPFCLKTPRAKPPKPPHASRRIPPDLDPTFSQSDRHLFLRSTILLFLILPLLWTASLSPHTPSYSQERSQPSRISVTFSQLHMTVPITPSPQNLPESVSCPLVSTEAGGERQPLDRVTGAGQHHGPGKQLS